MIGVVISTKLEFKTLKQIYNISDDILLEYPFGEYYKTKFNNKEIIFFRCGIGKINASASIQYMIDKFDLKKIILVGTCTAVNDSFNYLDVLIPQRIIDCDRLIKDFDYDISDDLYIDLEELDISLDYNYGILSTSDKPLLLWKDLTYLASIGVDASDTESYAVCKVCIKNNVKFNIIKGITDRPTKDDINNDEQIDVYNENTPIVIKKIIEDYLPEVL